jgi:hypothetical protein
MRGVHLHFENSIKPSLWVVCSYVINSLQTRTVESALLEDTITPWLGPLAPWSRHVAVYDDERARFWFALCIALSMLLHLALLLIPVTKPTLSPAAASSQVQGPLTVHLANPAPRAPQTEVKSPSTPPKRPLIAMRHPSSKTAPTFTIPTQPETPPPPQEPAVQPPPEEDMLTQLNAKRAARQAAEEQAAQENAAAAAGGGEPTATQRIMNNINRAIGEAKGEGTGGVFEVTHRGVREGTFKFNGWHPGSGAMPPQTYTVDAGEGGNVELAIVKKVIEVIRKYKKGDFEFESQRLGHPVTMSARPADNASLEAFLMEELFGAGSLAHPR